MTQPQCSIAHRFLVQLCWAAECCRTRQHDSVHLRRRRNIDECAVGDDVVEAVALDLHAEAVLLPPGTPALRTAHMKGVSSQD